MIDTTASRVTSSFTFGPLLRPVTKYRSTLENRVRSNALCSRFDTASFSIEDNEDGTETE